MKKVLFVVCITLAFAKSVFATGVIDIAYSPYTISNPGSYLVVKDLTTAINLDCIDIAASDVTIDLNGHTLYGAGSTTGSTGSGIYDVAVDNNITIKNGNIDGFRGSGVSFQGNNVQVSHLNIQNCGSYGIYISEMGVAENNNVYHCCAVEAHYQIYCGIGSIINNRASFSAQGGGISTYGAVVKDNAVFENYIGGIIAEGECKISGNDCEYNQGDGIYTDGSGASVHDNLCHDNAQNGINNTYGICYISKNICTSNGVAGIASVLEGDIRDNTCSANGTAGINASDRCNIRDNTIDNNGVYGIVCGTDCQVVGNMITFQISSSGYGIYETSGGTRIDSNHIASNNYGIYFASSANWYGRNTFFSNLNVTGGSAPADPGSPYTNELF